MRAPLYAPLWLLILFAIQFSFLAFAAIADEEPVLDAYGQAPTFGEIQNRYLTDIRKNLNSESMNSVAAFEEWPCLLYAATPEIPRISYLPIGYEFDMPGAMIVSNSGQI